MGIKEAIGERTQDALMLGTLMGSILWFMFALQVFSKDVANIIGPVGYFVIIGAGIFGSEIVIREMTNSFPFLDMIVRPGNERYGLFIRPGEEAVERKTGPNKYAATLPLKFAVNFREYGKCDKIILHHTGEWGSRIKFMPGLAFWNNIPVGHPQTETVIVTQTPRATTATDYGENIPIFFLEDASKDHYPVSMTTEFKEDDLTEFKEDDLDTIIGNPNANVEKVKNLIKSFKDQLIIKTRQLDEANRQKLHWHEIGISEGEIIEGKDSELDGLFDAGIGVRESAERLVVHLNYVYGGIKEIPKLLAKPKRPLAWLTQWAMLGIAGFIIFAIILVNPDLRNDVGIWLSSLQNQIVLIAILVIVVVVMYYYNMRKKVKLPK